MSEDQKQPFDFMGLRKIASIISISLIVVSIALLATRGLNFGMDFTGGTSVEFEYAEAPQLDEIRSRLTEAGYEQFSVQNFGLTRRCWCGWPRPTTISWHRRLPEP